MAYKDAISLRLLGASRMSVNINISGTDLNGRGDAARTRRIVLDVLKVQRVVYIYMHDALTITHNFADELFGVLAVQMGEEFYDRVKIHASDDVKLQIAKHMSQRL